MKNAQPLPDTPDGNRRLFRIEAIAALTLWCYLASIIVALAISRSSATILFLTQHDVHSLGMIYIFVAIAVSLVLYVLSQLSQRISQESLVLGTTVAIVLVTFLFFSLKTSLMGGLWLKKVSIFHGLLYLFVETCAVVSTLQFWTLSNTLFNWTQARRWYPFITTGGIIGSMVGGWITQQFSMDSPLQMIWVLVYVAPIIAGSVFILRYCRLQMPPERINLPKQNLSPVTENRLLSRPFKLHDQNPQQQNVDMRKWLKVSRNLSCVVFLTVFTTTLSDFYFKYFAGLHYADDFNGMSRFFGNYYIAVGITTLSFQTFITPLLLRFGNAFIGLTIMPLALLMGTLANLFSPSLLFALILKLIDSGLSHSVYRNCRELLFTPLPNSLVGSFKTLAEGMAGRLGLFCCGTTLLLFSSTLSGNYILIAIGISTIAWMIALHRLWLTYRHELPELWDTQPRENTPQTNSDLHPEATGG